MTPPIKPGTARRLSLRKPEPRPQAPKSFFDQWYDPSITGTFAGPGGYPVNPVPWWRRLFRREKS